MTGPEEPPFAEAAYLEALRLCSGAGGTTYYQAIPEEPPHEETIYL